MYFFIHNPKTAGTSLLKVLKTQIYFHKCLRINPPRDQHPKEFLEQAPQLLATVSQKRLAGLSVIGGHFAHGVHAGTVEAPKYITVLRQPVERVVSEYYFMKQLGFFHQKEIEAHNLSLTDYLAHPETRYLNNLQTRLVSGIPYAKRDMVDEEIYQVALANLHRMEAVGLTERFADSLAIFYDRLGWPRLPIWVAANSNSQKPATSEHTEEEIEAVRQRERWDLAIYAEAERIFEHHWQERAEKYQKLSKKIASPSKWRALQLQGVSYGIRGWNKMFRPTTQDTLRGVVGGDTGHRTLP